MKTTFAFIMIAMMLLACSNKQSENQYDANPAEATTRPGDQYRKNGDTNAEAARRAEKNSNTTQVATHPRLKDLGDSVGAKKPTFATKAIDAGYTEIYLAELAVRKTKNESIKQFAEQMIKDHTAANEELREIAEEKDIQLPVGCLTCDETYKVLHHLNTEEFNERYARMMVDNHEHAVKLFSDEAATGEDPEFKAWAEKKLGTLKHHLSMARDLTTGNTGVSADKQKPKDSKKKSK